MLILAAAVVVGTGALFVGFGCWVLRLFDHASELRSREFERIVRSERGEA